LATRKYPTILHVLDHPELRALFAGFDETAKQAKRKGRTFGLLAIALGFTALALAAFENLLHPGSGHASLPPGLRDWPTVLALVAAGCGLASVAIGSMGILFAKRKRLWLHQRFVTERVGSFNFRPLSTGYRIS